MTRNRRRRLNQTCMGMLSAFALILLPVGTGAGAAAPEATPIPLSRALDLLSSGSADSARILEGGATDTLVLADDGRRMRTPLPAELSDRALEAARAGDVPLIVQLPPAPKPTAPVATDGGGGGIDVGGFLQEWGHLLLLAALVVVAAMAVKQVGGARFKDQVRRTQSETRFTEVAGIDEIRDEVSEIVDVLRHPARYEAVGAELPKGVILHGPPGTGKTLLARAVAGEAGVPFFSVSASEFVEVYSGLGSKRVRALFAAARKAAPAVVYIDEIDAVGGRRTGHASSGEREQTLDQLLAEMDGFATDPAKPVVVMASTNRLADLDPALVRSGRFDRKIAVGLPGRAAREEILGVHLRRRPLAADANAAGVAAFTAGMAGADLAALCNEASFEAARDGSTSIGIAHFRKALMRLAAGPERRSRLMSDDELRLVAYHEIGHALVGHLSPLCDPVERVTVIPQGQALGVTISLPTEDRMLATRGECVARLAMMMAGRAAEELVFGEFTSGAADDLQRAAVLARRMVEQLGMAADTTSASLKTALPGATGSAAAERVEEAARALVEDGRRKAAELLEANAELMHRAAVRLIEAEALERDDLLELFGPRPEGRRIAPLEG